MKWLAYLVVGGLAISTQTASAATLVEAVPSAQSAPATMEIPLESGHYVVYARTESSGALLNVSGLGLNQAERRLGASQRASTYFVVSTPKTVTFEIVEGRATVAILRNDLGMSLPYRGPATHQVVNGTLPPGGCRGYPDGFTFKREDTLVTLRAPGGTVAVLNEELNPLRVANDTLSMRLPGDTIEAVYRVCAAQEKATDFVITTDYPVGVTLDPKPTPFPGLLGLLVVATFVFAERVLRRTSRGKQ